MQEAAQHSCWAQLLTALRSGITRAQQQSKRPDEASSAGVAWLQHVCVRQASKPPARGCFCRLPVITGQASPVITGQASPVITGQAWVRSDLSELPARLRAGCGSGGRVADPTVTAVRNVAGPPARLQAPRTQRRCCVSTTCRETSAALPLRISSSTTTHYSQHAAVQQDECCKALVDQRT